jgi:hypothetical protein
MRARLGEQPKGPLNDDHLDRRHRLSTFQSAARELEDPPKDSLLAPGES